MAVPYVLAIHEDYLKTCLALLQRGGISLKTKKPGDLKRVFEFDRDAVTAGSPWVMPCRLPCVQTGSRAAWRGDREARGFYDLGSSRTSR
jgi:hypothetical protein